MDIQAQFLWLVMHFLAALQDPNERKPKRCEDTTAEAAKFSKRPESAPEFSFTCLTRMPSGHDATVTITLYRKGP